MSKTQQITIYYTSDIHGYLFPTDYVDKQDKRMGLLKCVPNFKKDENTLIIDGGDMLQGSAMATFCQKNRELGFPQAQVLNYAGYDFVTIGNHDVNFGTDYLYEYLDALKAKCICENIFQKQTIIPFSNQNIEEWVKNRNCWHCNRLHQYLGKKREHSRYYYH
ncbi:metallophosphoesterase [Melissococcus plutonius]|uniref:metallophosphoesterase n=1 Tax=Melissococcus plutonius TaxID=33970 RepID=UPI000B0C0925|nr:metallophosphoesterase [Melissococcus plutonius]